MGPLAGGRPIGVSGSAGGQGMAGLRRQRHGPRGNARIGADEHLSIEIPYLAQFLSFFPPHCDVYSISFPGGPHRTGMRASGKGGRMSNQSGHRRRVAANSCGAMTNRPRSLSSIPRSISGISPSSLLRSEFPRVAFRGRWSAGSTKSVSRGATAAEFVASSVARISLDRPTPPRPAVASPRDQLRRVFSQLRQSMRSVGRGSVARVIARRFGSVSSSGVALDVPVASVASVALRSGGLGFELAVPPKYLN